MTGNEQVAADVAGWIGDHLGQACFHERDDLPAATNWTTTGPVATITLEDGSDLIVTVQIRQPAGKADPR